MQDLLQAFGVEPVGGSYLLDSVFLFPSAFQIDN